MKAKYWFLLLSLSVYWGCTNTNLVKTEKGVVIELRGAYSEEAEQKIALEVISPTVVKVAVSNSDSELTAPSLIVNDDIGDKYTHTVTKKQDAVTLSTDSLLVSVDLTSGEISFYDWRNRLLLTTTGNNLIPFDDAYAGNQHHVIQHFRWKQEEALFGLGQHPHGKLNLRNLRIELVQENTKVSVPFLLSSAGYGLLWDNYSRTVYNDVADSSYLWSDIGEKVQYYFIKGNSYDEIISQNRQLTGEVPMYPRWVLGYMQSRNRYRSEEELMGVVRKQRKLQIPMDVIILDYYHWDDQGFGSFVFDEEAFPDPGEMIKTLHEEYNCKLLVSVCPSFTPGNKNWNLFKRKGYLLDIMTAFNSQVYDAFNSDAVSLYYQLLRKSYLDKGVDGWWFDATEPEDWRDLIKSKCDLGAAAKYLNTYSYFSTKGVYEHQVRGFDKRVFMLTLSGFTGQQQFGTTVWSGDVDASFEELKRQIPTGLNFCMSGLPYWTTDIGGYKGGDPTDPAYQELFTRWFQYGTFCPIFRSHGRRHPGDRSGENEIWSYGEEKQKILSKFIELRYRLLPYIYSLSAQVTFNGFMIIRALPFDFIHDSKVHNITDQFMFGHKFLICPVTEAGATRRQVNLPKGCRWFDFWTGKVYDGGQEIEADAPIKKMPLFVKSGSIIPMGPVMQYSMEWIPDPIELHVYPGTDASFTLYEDENEHFNYKNGQFQKIPILYNDAEKLLIIGDSKDSYPGCLEKRTFQIVLAGKLDKTVTNKIKAVAHTVLYEGKKILFGYRYNK
jgi:alpha-D-xyloside xylohydrolase